MKTEEVKKKPATRGKKKKEENKALKIVVIVIIAIVSMLLGWLFASLMDNTHDVTFSVGNGLSDIVVKVEKDNGVLKPADPEKEGYTFEGWYYNGVRYDFSKPITEDMTITAIWSEDNVSVIPEPELPDEPEIVTYTVTFNSNGGSSVATQTIEKDKVAMEPTKPTRSGYTFNGWYNGDVKFDFTTKVTSNITLTAKWTKVEETKTDKETTSTNTVTKYTVTFNSNGGSKVSSKTVEKGKTVAKPSNPTRSGYTFLGWYNGSTKFDFSTKITKNITLTAKWEKKDVISYKIEEIPSSTLKQVRLYLTLNGKAVAGTADVINTQGQTIHVTVPASGLVKFVKGTIKSVTNIKVK